MTELKSVVVFLKFLAVKKLSKFYSRDSEVPSRLFVVVLHISEKTDVSAEKTEKAPGKGQSH